MIRVLLLVISCCILVLVMPQRHQEQKAAATATSDPHGPSSMFRTNAAYKRSSTGDQPPLHVVPPSAAQLRARARAKPVEEDVRHAPPKQRGRVKVERPESFEALEANSSLGIDYALFRASTDFECLRDPELEQLVHANGSRTRMYMLYHDERTGLIARRYAHCKDWIVPHRLRRSPYMESQVYRSLLQPQMRQHQLLEHFDFILTCTYRHALLGVDESAEHWVHPLSDDFLKQLIRSALLHGYDAVPLETIPLLPVLVSLNTAHDVFSVRAWNVILIKMAFTLEQLESCRHILGFWRSSYLIRTPMLRNLTALMVKAQYLVDTDAEVMKAFRKNARYGSGDPHVAMHIFNTTYYQMHPFIFERLPAFFLTALNASVPNLTTAEYRRPEFANELTNVMVPDW